MITKFELFKEGLLSKMKPKTDDEFLNSLKELDSPIKIIKQSTKEEWFQPGVDLAFDRGLTFNEDDFDLHDLIINSIDIDRMCYLIIKHKPELNDYEIVDILRYCDDVEKMASVLGKKNINKLQNYDIRVLIEMLDVETIYDILIKYRTKKIEVGREGICKLLTVPKDKKKIVSLFNKDNINTLYSGDVFKLLGDTIISRLELDLKEMASVLGETNINKLDFKYIYWLLKDSTDKKLLFSVLGKSNIDKLTDGYVSLLLEDSSDKEEMCQLLIEYKDLTDIDIKNIMKFTTNKEKTEKQLKKLGYKI